MTAPPSPAAASEAMIRIEGVTKYRGAVAVLQDVTLDVPRGQVVAWP